MPIQFFTAVYPPNIPSHPLLLRPTGCLRTSHTTTKHIPMSNSHRGKRCEKIYLQFNWFCRFQRSAIHRLRYIVFSLMWFDYIRLNFNMNQLNFKLKCDHCNTTKRKYIYLYIYTYIHIILWRWLGAIGDGWVQLYYLTACIYKSDRHWLREWNRAV